MTAAVIPPPPPAATPKASNSKPALGRLDVSRVSPRIILNAVEGWGKTSTAVQEDNSAIIMAKGETGYATLLNKGRVPERDAEMVESWPDTLDLLDRIANSDHRYEVLSIDAMGGFEKLCHEHVCRRDFKGDWGEKGFASFQKGYDVAVNDWIMLLDRLDAIREKHGTMLILLSHVVVKPYKNPMGADYDRIVADVHHKTWGPTAKWADAVLFGNFFTIVDEVQRSKSGSKGKGIGGTERVLYTERRDAFDAKNRYGMPTEMTMTDDLFQNWQMILNAINGGQSNV